MKTNGACRTRGETGIDGRLLHEYDNSMSVISSQRRQKLVAPFDYHGKEQGYVSIQKAHTSPVVREYLESDEWQALNYGDFLLYVAANRSLDLTINRLGKNRFNNALQIHRVVMNMLMLRIWAICGQEAVGSIDCMYVSGLVRSARQQGEMDVTATF